MKSVFVCLLSCLLAKGFAAGSPLDGISEEVLQELRDFNANQFKQLGDILKEEILRTEQEIYNLKRQLSGSGTALTKGATSKKPENATPVTSTFSHFGCVGDTISLQCAAEGTILVTSAYYGQFNSCADATCCAHHPINDCLESVEETEPSDWLLLTLECSNQNSCTYTVPSGTLSTCSAPNQRDFMLIYYTCLPEPADAVVGFTAYASQPTSYTEGDIMVFDQVVTNLGGYYAVDSNIFICPVSGIYVFSLSVTGAYDANIIDITIEDRQTVATRTHNANISQGSSVAVAECYVNERVWVKSTITASMQGGQIASKFTSFSGFLLNVL